MSVQPCPSAHARGIRGPSTAPHFNNRTLAIPSPTFHPLHAVPGGRARRRALLRLDRQRARAHARWQKGQTLIIFALSITILLGMAGLVIDVARAYDLYARMQRAADAGALAGVLYMPTDYNRARLPGDGQSAISRAVAEIYKDGFGTGVATIPAANPCPTASSSVEIAICPVPNELTDLEVIITEQIDVTLLGELGVTPLTLQVHAQAEYLPPIQVGSRENYFGDQVECSPANSSNTNTTACAPTDTTQNHLQYFMATVNGPAELKEAGDPFVYCAEGPAVLSPPGPDLNTSLTTYNGNPTDHQQWNGVPTGTSYTGGISQDCGNPVPGGNPGNPDYQPPGYDGPATAGTPHDGGYNYFLGINSSAPTSTLWIFNPFFIPQDNSSSAPPLDHFLDPGATAPNYYQGPQAEGIGASFDGQHRDAPIFYYSVTYTLWQVNDMFDRSTDGCNGTAGVPCAVETFSPYDDTSADLAYHGCVAGSQVYDPYWSGKNTPNWYHNPTQVTSGQGCDNLPLAGECAFQPSASGWCPLENCGIGLDPTSNPEKDVGSNVCANPGKQVQLQPGNAYRLVVEVTGINAGCVLNSNGIKCDYKSGPQDGWGRHTYALKLCAALGLSNPINCPNGDGSNGAGGFNNSVINIYGWNNEEILVQEQLSTASANPNFPQTSCVQSNSSPYACIDLGCISSLYAGRTVTLELFDPGDGAGSLDIGVAPPPNTSNDVQIAYPTYATTTTLDGDTVMLGRDATGYRPFHGLWVDVTIKLNSNYQGDCFSTGTKSGKSGWFQIAYIAAPTSLGAHPDDQFAARFTLVGSPVHLVTPVLS